MITRLLASRVARRATFVQMGARALVLTAQGKRRARRRLRRKLVSESRLAVETWFATARWVEVAAVAGMVYGRTAHPLLTWCVSRDLRTAVRRLAEVDPAPRDARGRTPLHVACNCDLPAAAAILLEAGASAHVACDGGRTPHGMAAKPGREAVAGVLEHAAQRML